MRTGLTTASATRYPSRSTPLNNCNAIALRDSFPAADCVPLDSPQNPSLTEYGIARTRRSKQHGGISQPVPIRQAVRRAATPKHPQTNRTAFSARASQPLLRNNQTAGVGVEPLGAR